MSWCYFDQSIFYYAPKDIGFALDWKKTVQSDIVSVRTKINHKINLKKIKLMAKLGSWWGWFDIQGTWRETENLGKKKKENTLKFERLKDHK